MYAFKDGVTVIEEDAMNELIAQHSFKMLYEGSIVASLVGAGTSEFDSTFYHNAMGFTLTGVTSISRVELDIAMDGTGADLTVKIYTDNAGDLGTLLKTVVVPKEFLPASQAYYSVPINLSGLTAGAKYWIVVAKAGDSTNHFHLYGEATNTADTFRSLTGTSDWAAENDIHFKVYSGNTGDLIHLITGTNMVETYIYGVEDLETIHQYCPPSDGSAGGIRKVIPITFDGDYLVEGVAT